MMTAVNPQPVVPPPVKDPGGLITAKLHVAFNNFFLQLPNIIGGIILILIAWVIARYAAKGIRHAFHHKDRVDLGGVLASITYGAIMAASVLIASVIIFPSVQPSTIISSLGIGSVSIGFAFKDILQNLLAGILLLINRPFRRGDQIVVQDYEGTVEHIQSRATLIKTYDGRRVIIPNSDIYTSPVMVNTAFPVRQSVFDLGIGYGDKPSEAAKLILAAIKSVEGVAAEPPPQVIPWALGARDVQLRVKWWTASVQKDVSLVKSRVVLTIFETCVENGIDLPFPTQIVLLHDQTEEGDGDRTQQREGWPAGKDPPRSRREAEQTDESISAKGRGEDLG